MPISQPDQHSIGCLDLHLKNCAVVIASNFIELAGAQLRVRRMKLSYSKVHLTWLYPVLDTNEAVFCLSYLNTGSNEAVFIQSTKLRV